MFQPNFASQVRDIWIDEICAPKHSEVSVLFALDQLPRIMKLLGKTKDMQTYSYLMLKAVMEPTGTLLLTAFMLHTAAQHQHRHEQEIELNLSDPYQGRVLIDMYKNNYRELQDKTIREMASAWLVENHNVAIPPRVL